MLLRDGRDVLLSDLGLARAVDAETVTRTGQIMGTLAYMAPEVLLGERAGPAADLYAAAVMYVETLSGALPFGGATLAETLERRREGRYHGLRSDGVPVPPGLERLIRRALSPRPEDRPGSAAAFLEELDAAGEAAEGAPARTAVLQSGPHLRTLAGEPARTLEEHAPPPGPGSRLRLALPGLPPDGRLGGSLAAGLMEDLNGSSLLDLLL